MKRGWGKYVDPALIYTNPYPGEGEETKNWMGDRPSWRKGPAISDYQHGGRSNTPLLPNLPSKGLEDVTVQNK